tara:strand:+ start:477 stop:1619 length:1143 start_codon:yes stop_codon:yes gene_type:complete
MFIPLLATLIMAGFVTTIGLVTEPAAEHFGVSISDIASQFSWLTAGVFVGGILAFFIFDHLPIKLVTIGSCLAAIVLIILLNRLKAYAFLPILLGLIGNFFAIVVCGGVTIITQQWRGHRSQMIMVAQDAMFNGGGIAFAALTTWFVVNSYGWSAVYLVVTLFLGFVVILAAVTSFEPAYEAEENESDEVEQWNLGIILVGVSLLLFMTAKIAIFVWAPQFVQQTFESGPDLAGEFMGNVFLAAFLGSLAGTWLASKISVRFLLYGFVLVSLLSVYAISSAQSTSSILFLGYCYGLSVSATYNSYIAFGLAFVSNPSHKNVVYLQLMSGLGSTVAPVVSSLVVHEAGSTRSALQLCFVLLLTVVLTLVISDALYRRRTFT